MATKKTWSAGGSASFGALVVVLGFSNTLASFTAAAADRFRAGLPTANRPAIASYLRELDARKAALWQRYPGTPTCGQCYYRALELMPYVQTRRDKLVANFYTGIFSEDGVRAFDCQHAVVVLRDGFSASQFPAPSPIPLSAIKYLVDPDLPGLQTLASFAACRNGIRFCHAGPRGPWDPLQ